MCVCVHMCAYECVGCISISACLFHHLFCDIIVKEAETVKSGEASEGFEVADVKK